MEKGKETTNVKGLKYISKTKNKGGPVETTWLGDPQARKEMIFSPEIPDPWFRNAGYSEHDSGLTSILIVKDQ